MTQLLKTLFLFLFICSFSNTVLAQKNRKRQPAIGLSMGSELLSAKLPQSNISSNFGLFFQYHYSEKISFATNLSIASRRYSQKQIYNFATGNISIYEHDELESAATIEFNYKYHFVVTDYGFSYFLGVGIAERVSFKRRVLMIEDFRNRFDYVLLKDKKYLPVFNLNVGLDYKNSDRLFLSTQIGVNFFRKENTSANIFSLKAQKSNLYLKIQIGQVIK